MPQSPDPPSQAATWRQWLPGLAVALLGGAALFALAGGWHSFGYVCLLLIPCAIGVALSYLQSVRLRPVLVASLVIALLIGLAAFMLTFEIAGLLCGLIVLIVIVAPLAAGMVLGALLRPRLERQRRAGRDALGLFGLFVIMAGMLYFESRLPMPDDIEVVSTSRILDSTADRAWLDLVFYEEIRGRPPLLTRLGLPRPLHASGTIARRGDLKLCVYDSGHLTKRITRLEPGRLLSFEVIEQEGIEDRSVELIDGSFRFEPVGPQATRVTLTTRYRPLLAARAIWRPFEHRLARTLHEHVLDGMEPPGHAWSDPPLLAQRQPR